MGGEKFRIWESIHLAFSAIIQRWEVEARMDNFDAEAKFERAPDGTIRIMKRPEFEKPPEYGSVEWVLQQPRGEPPVGNDVDPVAVGGVLALCVGALALCR